MKAQYGFTEACGNRKKQIMKLIHFRKKQSLRIKKVFFDILNIKRQKRYFMQMLLKQAQVRLNPLRLRIYFAKFVEGIFLVKTKNKLISLALKARMCRVQALAFSVLKKNLQTMYNKTNDAEVLVERRARALLMKSFFCWKFTTRDKNILVAKTDLLATELKKKKLKGAFRK